MHRRGLRRDEAEDLVRDPAEGEVGARVVALDLLRDEARHGTHVLLVVVPGAVRVLGRGEARAGEADVVAAIGHPATLGTLGTRGAQRDPVTRAAISVAQTSGWSSGSQCPSSTSTNR